MGIFCGLPFKLKRNFKNNEFVIENCVNVLTYDYTLNILWNNDFT